MAAPTQSHMPRSIFPDVPVSRRSSTTSSSLATVPAPIHTSPVSRRHTTYLVPSPMAVPPRREPRPLRSSPLAGPSLALSDDGTLTGSDESFETRRFKPNRISSTPDITMSTLMKLEGRSVTSLSEPNSPAGTYRGAPPPLAPDEIAVEQVVEKALPTPEPVKKSATRRLSLGFKRLSVLPGLPKADSDKSDTASVKSLSSSRSRTFSMSSLRSNKSATAPPVPSIPVWARPSHVPQGAPSASPASSSKLSEAQPIPRRPSTSPSNRSAASVNRRSVIYGSPEAIPPSNASANPSTSRNPEENWMSAAAAPKFSRLGLRGDGVVLPLTAKEVRRRSTIRVPASPSATSPTDADARTVRSMASRTSLRSLAASFQSGPAADTMPTPPTPPFRRGANTSSTSIASSTGSAGSCAESDFDTPSLSRASSDSGVSVDPESPRTPGVDELGVVHAAKDAAGAGVELRVNDVTVEIIGLRERERSAAVEVSVGGKPLPTPPAVERTTKGTPERKGTIKRVWRKLTGSTRG